MSNKPQIDYDIAYSGSSGNAVRIENLLFDIGKPYKDIESLVDQVDAIFISHKHPDHLNLPAYRKIRLKHPFLRIFGPMNVWVKLHNEGADTKNFIVTHQHETLYVNGTVVKIFEAKHEAGVTTNTYECYLPNLTSFVFGTDFYDFNDLPQGKYDAFFVEANHDARYREYLADKYFDGSTTAIPQWMIHSTSRHTTKQRAMKYYLDHRISSDSIFEPLHKSSRFYSLDW